MDKVSKTLFFSIGLFFISRKGFSLIEMLIVVGLLAILSGIAIVGYGAYKEQALSSALMKRIKLVESAVQSCYTLHNSQSDPFLYCDTMEKLGITIPANSKIGGFGQRDRTKVMFGVKKASPSSFCYQTAKAGSRSSRHCIQFNYRTGGTEKTLTPNNVSTGKHANCAKSTGLCNEQNLPTQRSN